MPLPVTVADLNQILDRQEFTRRYRFRVTAAGDGTCELLVPYLPENDRPGGIVRDSPSRAWTSP